MPRPLVLISGFGPFEEVVENPSARLARRLAADPPAGMEIAADVLPVSFARAPLAWDGLLASLAPRVPDCFLALGVHRQPGFRLERLARGTLAGSERVDVDGRCAAETTPTGGDLETSFDVASLVAELTVKEGASSIVSSEDAGGYVCERLYHHVLARARALARPALFVHVPSEARLSIARQETALHGILAALVASR